MSWHTSGVLINTDFSEDLPGFLEKLGFTAAESGGDTVTFEEATSSGMEELAVSVVDGWTCLFSSFALFLINDKQLAKVGKESKVFSFTLEGSSGAAGFEWWVEGKKVRERMVVEGSETVNKGKPLPEEKVVFAKEKDDEQRVLLLMEKLTVSFKGLSKARFQVFSCDE